jgi:hypothetical protein
MQWWITFSEIVRNFGLVAGGAVGIFLAWQRVRAANKQAEAQIRQAALARQDHVAELFNRAVGQLKDEKLEVRLGAILTLGQICRDFPDLADPVVRLLTTYLRENRVDYGDNDPPADVREITFIVRGRPEEGP